MTLENCLLTLPSVSSSGELPGVVGTLADLCEVLKTARDLH